MDHRKQAYFTPKSIASKAGEMQRFLAGLHRQQPHFVPERSALLALDLQAYFLDETSHAFVPSGPAILPGINALIRAYVRRGLPVFLTRHMNTPTDAGPMASWWRDLITAENPLSRFDVRLDLSAGVEIRKTRYDAFFDTPLESLLNEREIHQVVIGGLMTHLCCETTARSAFMRGFEVFFLVDGTATYTEDFHRASLLNLAHGFATPILVAEILEALGD
jgi:isochorismate hydrolase